MICCIFGHKPGKIEKAQREYVLGHGYSADTECGRCHVKYVIKGQMNPAFRMLLNNEHSQKQIEIDKVIDHYKDWKAPKGKVHYSNSGYFGMVRMAGLSEWLPK